MSDQKLLDICNLKWKNEQYYHNLTPRYGSIKFKPAKKIHSIKEYDDHFIVLLDAGIRGTPKFKVYKSELNERN